MTPSRLALAAALTGAGALVAGCGTATEPRAEVTPSEVTVACTPHGIDVSPRTFAATPAGAVFHVSSTMPRGAYLNFGSTRWGSGEVLPAEPATWTLPIPPGDIELSCTMHGDPAPGATDHVALTDPSGSWRRTSLEQLGCTQVSQPSWIAGLTQAGGARPDEAVSSLLEKFGSGLTARPADIGYVDAATATWLASADGKPYLTVDVIASGAGFEASPNWLCG